MHKTIDFLGIEISAITGKEIVDKIVGFALTGKHKMMTYINAHCVNISFSDLEYRRILRAMDLIYAGGKGVVWASRLFTESLPERVNILDFFDNLAERMIEEKIKIYLLGGRDDVIKRTEKRLREKGLNVVGSRCGFFDDVEEAGIIKEINRLKPEILMVGMGIPKQEKWIFRHLEELNVNLCWAVGAAFDWLSGYRKRAPQWMVDCGLEWLHRLYQQPRRLWKRYLIGNIIFTYHGLRWLIRYNRNNTN